MRTLNYCALALVVLTNVVLGRTIGEWQAVKPRGTAPLERPLHACAIHNSKMYVFGGRPGVRAFSNEMFVYDINAASWAKLHPKVLGDKGLPGLFGHSLTKVGEKLYIFAGRTGLFETTNDLYEYDIGTEEVRLVPSGTNIPAARQGHTATAVDNRYIVVYGGMDGTGWLNDLHIYDTKENAWHQGPSSDIRSEGHQSVLVGNKIFVFGGYDGEKYLNTIQVLVLDASQQSYSWNILPTEVSPRAYHSASAIGNNIYLFGGMNNEAYLHETLLFDAASYTWSNDKTDGAEVQGRQGHCSVPYQSRIVLFGGSKTWKHRYNDIHYLETIPAVEDLTPKIDQVLSETITDLIFNINFFMSGANSSLTVEETRDIQETVDRLKTLMVQDNDYLEFADVPDKISACNNVEASYKALQKVKQGVSSATVNVSSHLEQIAHAKAEYDDVKATLLQEKNDLENQLEKLRKCENEEKNEIDATKKAKAAVESAKKDLTKLETQERNQAYALADKQKIVNSLRQEEDGYRQRLNNLKAIVENSADIMKQDEEREALALAQQDELSTRKAKLDDEISVLRDETNQLEEKIRIQRGHEKRLLEYASKPQEAKMKWAAAQASFKEYNKEKRNLLSFLESEIEEPSSATEAKPCSSDEENELKKIDDLITNKRRDITGTITKLQNDLKEKQSLLEAKRRERSEIEDKESRIKQEKTRLAEKLLVKGKERESTEKEKDLVERDHRLKQADSIRESSTLESLKNEYDITKDSIGRNRADSRQKNQNLDEQQKKEIAATNALNQLKQDLNAKHRTTEELFQDAKKLDDRLLALRQQLRNLGAEYSASRGDIDDSRVKLMEAQKSVAEHFCAKEIDALKRHIRDLQDEIAALKAPTAQATVVELLVVEPLVEVPQVVEPLVEAPQSVSFEQA
jgi:N-acetylneuraminic acid mutarotase